VATELICTVVFVFGFVPLSELSGQACKLFGTLDSMAEHFTASSEGNWD
jgi:hypothetical protein